MDTPSPLFHPHTFFSKNKKQKKTKKKKNPTKTGSHFRKECSPIGLKKHCARSLTKRIYQGGAKKGGGGGGGGCYFDVTPQVSVCFLIRGCEYKMDGRFLVLCLVFTWVCHIFMAITLNVKYLT